MIDKIFDGGLLEALLNHALQLDPAAQEKLAPLEGKTISVALDIREQPWILRVSDGCFVFEDEALGRNCDVRLRGTIGGFMRLFDQSGRSHGVNEKLYIEGDLHSAQQFQRVMASLSPDFDMVLKNRFGERLGGMLSAAMQQVRGQGESAKAEIESRLQAYFRGEDAQCATREQSNALQQRLSSLRMALDRLDARVKRMES